MKKFGKKFAGIFLVLALLITSIGTTNVVFAEGEEEDETLRLNAIDLAKAYFLGSV